jgi:hypothetical protein
MKIKDITLGDIKAGKNWIVKNPNMLLDDNLLMEELEIHPLDKYSVTDTIVYGGIYVWLKDLGEPCTSFLARITGRGRRIKDCKYPPEDPKNLDSDMIPLVKPLVMIKEIQDSGWDYCEYVDGHWQQLGLKPNPDAPLSEEYFADPDSGDPEFDICGDDGPIRDRHKKGFQNWVKYLK